MSDPVPSLSGLFPPVPTAFDDQGNLHLDAFQANLHRWNTEPLNGYVVGGSNGEFVLLTPEERLEVVRAARQVIGDDRLLIAGAGAESTRATLALCDGMAHLGVDALLLVTPSYYKSQMGTDAFVRHYTAIADAASVPLILYNVPANTGINLPPEAVRELAKHPRIIGVKDSGGDIVRLAGLVADTPADFQVLAGSASFLLAALSVGAVGCVPALGNLAGGQLAALMSCFEAGDISGARAIQHRMLAPNRAVTSQYGVPGLKTGLDLLGYYGGPVRGPLGRLSDADRDEVERILRQADIL
jgi:4-hydroxy-2-oxoglutarate aldolase